jgi:drug/metabolite transporter (DMT)-like permease
MVFWYLLLVGLGAAALALPDWRGVDGSDWIWLAGIGVSGALGQLWLTEAFSHAPPSVVGPFEYMAILWAFGIDWLFWSASPSMSLVAGAAVVVASGIVVVLDERRMAESAAAAALTPP